MKKNRIIAVILLIAVFLAAFSVVSLAAGEDTADTIDTPEVSTDTEIDGETDEGEGSIDTENVFETLFIKVKNHAGEICSALALIASLILAYCYKCGLMPIIQNALSAISSVLTRAAARVRRQSPHLRSDSSVRRS